MEKKDRVEKLKKLASLVKEREAALNEIDQVIPGFYDSPLMVCGGRIIDFLIDEIAESLDLDPESLFDYLYSGDVGSVRTPEELIDYCDLNRHDHRPQ